MGFRVNKKKNPNAKKERRMGSVNSNGSYKLKEEVYMQTIQKD